MTLDQLKPQLKAAGLDVDVVLATLTPVITADDLATLAQVATQPISLQYVLSFEGNAAVLSSAPATKLFEYRYQQTPASVTDEVKSMRNQIRLAELYVPFGLLAAAVLSLAVGAFVYWRRRGPTIDLRTAPPVVKPAPEREPVSSGTPR